MSKKLTTNAAALLQQLLEATAPQRDSIAEEHELKCDFTEANRLAAERTEVTRELEQIQERIQRIREAEYEALKPCVADYVVKLEPGWITPDFINRLNIEDYKRHAGSVGRSMQEIFTCINQGISITPDEGHALAYIYTSGRTRTQDERRIRNILHVCGKQIRGRTYSFTMTQAKRLCEWALPYWRGETSKVPRTLRHDYETHDVAIYDTHIAIGCQTLAKEEVVRIASLFGWAGQPKLIGPEYGKEGATPATKKRSRSKEPVAA